MAFIGRDDPAYVSRDYTASMGRNDTALMLDGMVDMSWSAMLAIFEMEESSQASSAKRTLGGKC